MTGKGRGAGLRGRVYPQLDKHIPVLGVHVVVEFALQLSLQAAGLVLHAQPVTLRSRKLQSRDRDGQSAITLFKSLFYTVTVTW